MTIDAEQPQPDHEAEIQAAQAQLDALRWRDELLETVLLATERLLRTGQLEQGINEILLNLGRATGADRVYVARHQTASEQCTISVQHEWTHNNVAPMINHPQRQNVPVSDLERWTRQLEANRSLLLQTDQLPSAELAIWAVQDLDALLLVPLFVRGKWWGFIGLDNYGARKTAPPQPHEIETIITVARITGAALENALAQRETHARAQQLAALHQVGRTVGSTLDVKEIARLTIERTCEMFQAPAGAIHLADLIADVASAQAVIGLSPQDASRIGQISLQDSFIGQVVITGRPLFLESRSPDGISEIAACLPQAQSEAIIPLAVGEHVLGTLGLVFDRPHMFSVDEQTLLLAIGRQVGIALANARLFDEVQLAERETRRRAEQLVALHEIARIVNSGHDLRHTLDLLLEQLKRLLPYDSATVFLRNGDVLRVAAGKGFENPERVMSLSVHIRDNTLMAEIFDTRQPIVLHDAQQEDRFKGFSGTGYVRGWIGTPLLVGTDLVGVLTVDSRQAGAFDKESAQLVQSLADQVAVVIHKARLLEDLQYANLELRQLDGMKNQFIQNVTHELRTPLTLVRGYIEMLNEENLNLDPKTRRQALKTALHHTQTLVHLVESITTLQDLNLEDFVPESIVLTELIETVVQVVHQKANRAQIKIKVQLPPRPPRIFGDFIWLAQALYQLLDNAIKFSPNGHSVWIRSCIDKQQKELSIMVEDQGVGIPASEQKRIFELFYQVDGTMTRHFGGTGLGLAIVRRVVQRHGGRVWVESPIDPTPGTTRPGSRFVIQLPYLHT